MPQVSAIYAAAGKELVLSDRDALWLARMVVGEGGRTASTEKMRALIWAISNRYLLLPAQRKRSSLTSILQAFSQPINPRWDGEDENDNDFCVPGGKWYGTKFCDPSRLKRRAQMMSMPWSAIPKKIQTAVEQFRSGDLPQPKAMAKLKAQGKPYKINNWASLPSTPKKFPGGIDIDGDWFFEDEGTLKTDVTVNGVVQRMKESGAILGGLLPGLAIGGALGVTVYLIAKQMGYYQ